MFLVGGILDHWDFLRGTEFHQRPGATNKSRGCSTAFLRHPFLACLRVSKKNLLSLHKIRLHELGPDDSVWPQLSKLPNFGSFSLRVSFVRLWFPDLDVVGFHVVVSVESTHVFSWVTCCQLPPNQKKDAPQMGVDLLTKWLGPVNPKQTLHWSPSGVFIPAVFLWSWGKKSNKKEVLFVGILMFCIMPLGTGNWDLFFGGGSGKGHTPENLTWHWKIPHNSIGNTSTHSWLIFQPVMLVFGREKIQPLKKRNGDET